MSLECYEKKYVALVQLETALRLYYESKEFFSVITLAGAAEEILGKLLAGRGIENSLDALKRSVAEIHQMLFDEPISTKDIADLANHARNSLKHIDRSTTVSLDVREEAKDILDRAIRNYWLLEQDLTPAMLVFQREKFPA